MQVVQVTFFERRVTSLIPNKTRVVKFRQRQSLARQLHLSEWRTNFGFDMRATDAVFICQPGAQFDGVGRHHFVMLRQDLSKRQIVAHFRAGNFVAVTIGILKQHSQAIAATRQFVQRQQSFKTAICCLRPVRKRLDNVIAPVAGGQCQHFLFLRQHPNFHLPMSRYRPAANQVAATRFKGIGYIQLAKRQIVAHFRPGNFAAVSFAIIKQYSQAIAAMRQFVQRQLFFKATVRSLRPSGKYLGNVVTPVVGGQCQHFFVLRQHPYFHLPMSRYSPAANQVATTISNRIGNVQHAKRHGKINRHTANDKCPAAAIHCAHFYLSCGWWNVSDIQHMTVSGSNRKIALRKICKYIRPVNAGLDTAQHFVFHPHFDTAYSCCIRCPSLNTVYVDINYFGGVDRTFCFAGR